MTGFLLTIIFSLTIVALLCGGATIFATVDNGTDFVDPSEIKQSILGCSLMLVGAVLASSFVYIALS